MSKVNNLTEAEAMSLCMKHGLTVYPVYLQRTQTIQGKKYSGNNWYIEVNNNGKKTIYNKSIGTGTTLKSNSKSKTKKTDDNDWGASIMKVWFHWGNLIQKNKNEKTE